MQDMGYYPFGNKYFSDLTHYVAKRRFRRQFDQGSFRLDEYAFALGALAHYSADNCGHPTVNQAVGLEFPKLRKKFGNVVTYEDNLRPTSARVWFLTLTQVRRNRLYFRSLSRLHRLRNFQTRAGAGVSGYLRHSAD